MGKKALILGGKGLIAREVAKLLATKNYEVTIFDRRKKPDSSHEFNVIQGDAFKERTLSKTIKQFRPDIIINGINIATIFSQDTECGLHGIINFYLDLYESLSKIKKRADYIQIGTTGSGGLGFNIPFTHGEKLEDIPIVRKAAFSGITTSMLTLLSRSFNNGTIIAEIKPALAVFSRKPIVQPFHHTIAVLLDGGESGLYTYNEVALLTSFMGFTTSDRVARKIYDVLKDKKTPGLVTKYDVIDHINHASIDQEARDFIAKKRILREMKKLTEKSFILASGNLGPPSITRDLLLAHLIVKFKKQLTDKKFTENLTSDVITTSTLTFIKTNNSALAAYLFNQLTYNNYLALYHYYERQKSAWELLRDIFQARS